MFNYVLNQTLPHLYQVTQKILPCNKSSRRFQNVYYSASVARGEVFFQDDLFFWAGNVDFDIFFWYENVAAVLVTFCRTSATNIFLIITNTQVRIKQRTIWAFKPQSPPIRAAQKISTRRWVFC